MSGSLGLADRCAQCRRPAFLYGHFDVQTQWRGWCRLCNLEWRRQKARSAAHARLLHVFSILGCEPVVELVLDFILGTWHDRVTKEHDKAFRTIAEALFFGGVKMHAIVSHGPLGTYEADSEDELLDGVLDPYLNFVCPLWHLRLARDPHYRHWKCCQWRFCGCLRHCNLGLGRAWDLTLAFLGFAELQQILQR